MVSKKILADTLCVMPVRLFFDGKPTTLQSGDVMVYRPHDTICFLRGIQPICIGQPRGDTRFNTGRLSEEQFMVIGHLISSLFGLSYPSAFSKLDNGRWVWTFGLSL